VPPDELRLPLEELRLRLPLDEARLRVPLDELRLRVPLEALRLALDELLDRFAEPDRPLDERDRLFVDPERGRLVDPERERERAVWPERRRPPSPRCCWSPSSSLSNFLATPTAAGTATPRAAPAATFLPVDIPSFSTSSM
jgi:hypothetical protein